MKRWIGRRAFFLSGGLVMAIACIQATRTRVGDPVSTGARLSPGEERSGTPGNPVFRVTFAGPQGNATLGSEINVGFSLPLKALEADVPTPEIRISPAIAGDWIWVGARALRFVPKNSRLGFATAYRVEVPATLRALDGKALGKPYRFQFETARPTLVKSEPANGSEGLGPTTKLRLYFNQTIDPREVQRHTTLFAEARGKRRALAFRVERPDPKQGKRLLLTPSAPLPLASRILLEFDATLRGEEGELPSGLVQPIALQTYGPLAITHDKCEAAQPSGCVPGSSIELRFSNPVSWDQVRRTISLFPAVPIRWSSWQSGEATTLSVSLNATFHAATVHTARVDGSLRDVHGQTLGATYLAKQRFGDYPSTLRIGMQGEALEPSRAQKLPISYRNLEHFNLIRTAVPESALFGVINHPDLFTALSGLPGARVEPVRSSVLRNQIGRIDLDPSAILGGQGRGVLALASQFVGQQGRQRQTTGVVKVSDLAITGKLSRHGSLFWVTRLSTGLPVPRAEVTLLSAGQPAKRYQADVDGLVRVESRDFSPNLWAGDAQLTALVVARAEGDWTFERVRDYLSPWRVPVDVDLTGGLQMYGLLFSDRGVYRPGDELRLKGIVRDQTPTGNAVPRGRTLDLTIFNSQAEKVDQRRLRTSDFGTFSSTLRLPPTGQLGTYRIVVRSADRSGELSSDFEVAEYRPAEFKVNIEPKTLELTRGERVEIALSGEYLYGAPMAGAKLQYSFARQPESISVPGHDGWVTDAKRYYSDLAEVSLPAGRLSNGAGTLGPDGTLRIAPHFDLPGQRWSERILVSAELSDATRQAVAGSRSILVHPAEFLVAFKAPEDSLFNAPRSLAPEVVALTPLGQRLAGQRVTLELVRRRWTLSRQDLGDGETRAVSKPVDQVVATCSLTTTARTASCPLAAPQGGYYLVVARAYDAKKRLAEASIGLYGTGDDESSWGDNDRAELEIVPNKARYLVGETARFLIKSPFKEADALVTVERAGVYRAQRLKLSGASPTISIQVTPDLAPNAFVSVHMLLPQSQRGTSGPAFRYGYAPIPVDPEARRLTLEVTPKKTILRPGEEVAIALALKDRAGQKARGELTVYAVDEGVLMLTGYKTPDPIPVFGAARPLQVATLETRERLAKVSLSAFDALGTDKGADGGGGGLDVRRDFRQVAFFEPGILTDAEGRAQVRFKLPDSLTSYRVMAVAVGNDDRYGYAEARVTVNKPLMLRPALPRFLRAGDRLEASVVVAAKNVDPGTVTVSATASGVLLDGPTRHEVRVRPDASVEVRFPLRALRVGTARLDFRAEAGKLKDTVSVTRPVKLPLTLETVTVDGATQGATEEKLGDLSQLRNDAGQLEVVISSSALNGLDRGLNDLREYPYGCTEQLASGLLPLGPLAELGRAFSLPIPKDTTATRDRAIALLLERQRGDGGFGMWPEALQSSAWVTPYALWVLQAMRQAGARIADSVFVRGKDFLRRNFARDLKESPATAAFALDVLARLEGFDPGYAEELFKVRDRLPIFAQGLLLHALVIGRGPGDARRLLSQELKNRIRIGGDTAQVVENLGDEYAALLDSPTRTNAIVLYALLADNPKEPLASRIARGLLKAREQGSWRSTQETAFTLLALDAYRRAQEGAAPSFDARFAIGERELLTLRAQGPGLHARHAALPLAELINQDNRALSFEMRGRGTLFYELRLQYARKTSPSRPLDAGFFVKKTLRAVKPSELASALKYIPEQTATRFTAGELVVADLALVVPSPARYVVLDDPLPAGLEAIDTGLLTTPSWLKAPDEQDCFNCDEAHDSVNDDALAHGTANWPAWHRRELRDDRALFFIDEMPAGIYRFRYLARATSIGRFVVPPTKAELMYQPDVFGRTAAELVEVVP